MENAFINSIAEAEIAQTFEIATVPPIIFHNFIYKLPFGRTEHFQDLGRKGWPYKNSRNPGIAKIGLRFYVSRFMCVWQTLKNSCSYVWPGRELFRLGNPLIISVPPTWIDLSPELIFGATGVTGGRIKFLSAV